MELISYFRDCDSIECDKEIDTIENKVTRKHVISE